MNAAISKTTDNSTGAMPDKTKKIIVPDFTTFNSYFFDRKHGNMKRKIYNYLKHELEAGEFSRLTGFEILTNRITAKCCKLEKLRYRGIVCTDDIAVLNADKKTYKTAGMYADAYLYENREKANHNEMKLTL